MRIDEKYNYKTTPIANDTAIIKGDKYRFTVLTPRLIRIEYNENGFFEDRATQTVINRRFDVPRFSVNDTDEFLSIKTEFVELIYDKTAFSPYSLTVNTYSGNLLINSWHYNEENATNLKGTCRTLDGVDGECELENGIMSRDATPVLFDDSRSLIIDDDGWIETRTEFYKDQYLFCYGQLPNNYDYKSALKEFYMLTGGTPLLPRYTLGNWWSRYYAYTQDEYIKLMDRFKQEDIPFGVSVIDMDWHIVKIDPKFGSGWTGYTWNEELFPDYKAFLKHLHAEGLEVTLNIHPAEGVAPHEKPYREMAEAMGINPDENQKVLFDITSPQFLENYFKILHHPLEEDGVTFWWIDWQQGTHTSVPGLDPLWMLNHFHYIDNGRKGKRPLTFSRFAGAGSHRYPIGFSGDTIISWESLDFQPYFTSTASNIGYGWWSHDIGGHMQGKSENELICRWVQLGVFSPINRLHSSNSLFTGKEPWNYDKTTELSMKKFLKLRHELIPYLYTMNYLACKAGEPLVQPLYYNWSGNEAFEHKNEFTFGTEMLVSPITKPHDADTMRGSALTYLPDGVWYDFFTNNRYNGGKTLNVYRGMYDMPVFVKAGGIIPMAKLTHINDVANPESMKIKVFAGADNVFELYEDDGVTNEYLKGAFATTKMQLEWGEKPTFTIFEPIGDRICVCPQRNFEIEFIGIEKNTNISVFENESACEFTAHWVDGVLTVKVENISGTLRIAFDENVYLKPNDIIKGVFNLLHKASMETDVKGYVYNKAVNSKTPQRMLEEVCLMDIGENIKKALCEIITAES